jgi:hypothetical protein
MAFFLKALCNSGLSVLIHLSKITNQAKGCWGRVELNSVAERERQLSDRADIKKPSVVPGSYFGYVPTRDVQI